MGERDLTEEEVKQAKELAEKQAAEEAAAKDELKEYLALPQIKYKSEKDVVWWLEHQEHSSRTSR